MSLDIAIKVDPGNAIPTIAKVEAELGKAEAMGPKVGKAISAGLREGSLAADKAKSTFTGLTGTYKAAAEMFERINRPVKQFAEDMAAIETLQRKGLLTAKQYADELERIGKAAGMSKGNPMDAVSLPGMPKAPEAAEATNHMSAGLTGMIAPAIGVAGALSVVDNVFGHWKDHNRQIAEATNTILKFHDGINSASASMGEQIQLSEDLHLNITKTAHAYADVREATAGFGLTSKQQVDITRNLTAALVNDGGTIEDVAAVMGKLQYAMDAGTLSQRDLKNIWMQSDDVANMLADSLGVTYQQLTKMAGSGKLGRAEIEKMTVGMGAGHKSMDMYGQRLVDINDLMEKEGVEAGVAAMKISVVGKETDEAGETIAEAMERIAASSKHAFDEGQKYKTGLSDVQDALDGLGNALGRVSTLLNDPWDTTGPGDFSKKIKAAMDISTPVMNAKQQLKSLDDGWKALTDHSAGNAAKYREARHALVDTISGESSIDYYMEQLKAIVQPEKDWTGRLGALNSLHDQNRIKVEQYNAALKALIQTYAGMDVVGGIDKLNKSMGAESGTDGFSIGGISVFKKRLSANQNNAAMDRIDSGLNRQNRADSIGSDFGSDVDQTLKNSPSDLSADLSAAGPGIDRATELTRKWRLELGKTTDQLSQLNELGTSAFNQFGDALATLATTGKGSFSDMVDSMISDLTRLATQKLMMSLLGGLGSLGSTTTYGPGVEAIAGGSGGWAALHGGANGFDSMVPGGRGPFLPGFATGGDMMVGGSGGTDSKLAMFRVTPGESIHVRTPAQQAAAQQGGGSQRPIVINNHVDVERRALMTLADGSADQHIVNAIRRNPGAVRALIGK